VVFFQEGEQVWGPMVRGCGRYQIRTRECALRDDALLSLRSASVHATWTTGCCGTLEIARRRYELEFLARARHFPRRNFYYYKAQSTTDIGALLFIVPSIIT